MAASVLAFASSCGAQVDGIVVEAVGGISINADGVLKNATLDGLGNLNQFRAKNLQKVPDGLGPMAEHAEGFAAEPGSGRRRVREDRQAPAQDIKFLGGLQAIRYVLVYPEQHDIVLVGPGEGWRVDTRGNLVGVTTGRPVMLAGRPLGRPAHARSRRPKAASPARSIPMRNGQANSATRRRTFAPASIPRRSPASAEQTLGTEAIRFHGVPATSHFARILVAADYHMKRLAMNFDPSPVRGLPSYLQMLPPGGRAGTGNMMQRWWLEPKYESVLRDAEGLSWEFRGGSVQAMTEEDFLTANGAREHTGKANRLAQRWADNMTKKYNALAVAEPIFGQLQNCMELAIVGALIVKENLPAKTGNSLPALMDEKSFKTEEYRRRRRSIARPAFWGGTSPCPAACRSSRG